MQTTQTAKKELIPANIRIFLVRGLILVAGWKLLYLFVLAPSGFPDNQLTAAVQWGTVEMLKPFFGSITQSGPSIFINGLQSINIAPQCNGLELMVLYIGFIICIPANIRKMVLFSIGGLAVIYLLNVLRCSLLAWLYYDHFSIADFAHHYAFKMLIYAVVFYGWVLYSKKPVAHA